MEQRESYSEATVGTMWLRCSGIISSGCERQSVSHSKFKTVPVNAQGGERIDTIEL